jgi:hypothetical protein
VRRGRSSLSARRIGVLMPYDENEPAGKANLAGFTQGLAALDRVPVPMFGPRMVCTHCGIIGADARPNWRDALR